MAFYLLPAYSGGCCPVCPPPGSCTCSAILDCIDCTPSGQELDDDCNPILADTDGDGVGDTPIDIDFEACTPAAGTSYDTFEADHPEGDGWVVIEGCNACNECDSSPTIFVSEGVAAGNEATLTVDFVALTNTGQASVVVTANDCLCTDPNQTDTVTLASSAGNTVGGQVVARREPGGVGDDGGACEPALLVECESIPGDCCGWKLAYKIDLVPIIVGGCCAPTGPYNSFETDFPVGDGWTHLTSEQLGTLRKGTLSLGEVTCGTGGLAEIAVVALIEGASVDVTVQVPSTDCFSECDSLGVNTGTASANCFTGAQTASADFLRPIISDSDPSVIEQTLTLDNPENLGCCDYKVAYRNTLYGSGLHCFATSSDSHYCAADNGAGKEELVFEITPSLPCCVDPDEVSIQNASCSANPLSPSGFICDDVDVVVDGMSIRVTPSTSNSFPVVSPDEVRIRYQLLVTTTGTADCSCGVAVSSFICNGDFGSECTDPGNSFFFTETIETSTLNCCLDGTDFQAFQAFSCDYGDNDCDNLQRQGVFDGNNCSYS